MARKGILVNSREVSEMSDMQWAFEYYALRKKEMDDKESNFTMLKHLLVNVLGLNALRPENEHGIPKKFEEMTEEEKEAYLPLVAWCARPDMIKPVAEQLKAELAIKEADENKAYEEMVAAIDAADGDMEPVLGPLNPNVGKAKKQYPSDNKGSESINIDNLVEDV